MALVPLNKHQQQSVTDPEKLHFIIIALPPFKTTKARSLRAREGVVKVKEKRMKERKNERDEISIRDPLVNALFECCSDARVYYCVDFIEVGV